MRIFKYNNTYYYTGTSFIYNTNHNLIHSNIYNIEDNTYKLINRTPIYSKEYDKENNITEKNWAMFNYNNNLCIVYKWYPLQIGKIDYEKNLMNIIDIKYNIPLCFQDARGNSCGFTINNEIWFILHTKINNKYYLHFFAIFDLNMNLLRYSDLFKFENIIIEFCIGMIVKEKELIVSYSLLDTQCIIAKYDMEYIKNNIKWYIHNKIRSNINALHITNHSGTIQNIKNVFSNLKIIDLLSTESWNFNYYINEQDSNNIFGN